MILLAGLLALKMLWNLTQRPSIVVGSKSRVVNGSDSMIMTEE